LLPAGGELSAQLLTAIAYHATQAGAIGVEFLALDPKQRKHAARHIAAALQVPGGMQAQRIYCVQTPLYDKSSARRVVKDVPMRLPSEILDEIHRQTPSRVLAGLRGRSDFEFDGFLNHPIVIERGAARTCGITLYMDSTQCSVYETFISCYLNIMWERGEGSRELIFALQKGCMCRCGCGGRCSLMALLSVVVQNLNLAAEGLLSSCRYDNEPFRENEQFRADRGTDLGFFVCLVQLRGDWAEPWPQQAAGPPDRSY
jgi:hypothetical protein